MGNPIVVVAPATTGTAPSGPDPQTAPPQTVPVFNPSFQQNVTILFGLGQKAGVSPLYCATEETAKVLQQLLLQYMPQPSTPLQLVDWPPDGPMLNGLVVGTENPNGVPWFALPNGNYCNVGLLCSYFTHGNSFGVSMRNCLEDIAESLASQPQGM